jgi:hypothetical protein
MLVLKNKFNIFSPGWSPVDIAGTPAFTKEGSEIMWIEKIYNWFLAVIVQSKININCGGKNLDLLSSTFCLVCERQPEWPKTILSALWRTALCFVFSVALTDIFSYSFSFPGERWKTGSYHKFSLRPRNVVITAQLHTTGPIFTCLLENQVTVRVDLLNSSESMHWTAWSRVLHGEIKIKCIEFDGYYCV